ncbi:MAG: transglycosylase SLT domain-containing protein [Geobacteraceae bacterium]|nr:transglycosylase SLT domain-containing protein [Geobacteraceae bacterium]
MKLSLKSAALTLFLLPLAASAEQVPQKQLLTPAGLQMKLKNYSTAYTLAASLSSAGPRDLLMGMAEFRRGRNAEAAVLLGKGLKSYPLLADYAMFYRAEALKRAGSKADAAALLGSLQKEYSDSPLLRKSLLQEADLYFDSENYSEAERAYQKFIEKYPSGSDAVLASYRLAICLEKRGDGKGAAVMLRLLWLNSPGSQQAVAAEADLKRLATAKIDIKPYSAQELFKRASTLYDQRRYDQALASLRIINTKDEKREFADRVALKSGQALLKSKQYQAAEKSMKELAGSDARVATRSEAAYLAARAVEKSGRDEEAFAAYTGVATSFPDSAEADDALLDAAFVRKFQYRPKDTALVLEKLLASYPATKLKQRVIWESGWANYLSGNYVLASEQLKKVTTSEEYREKGLYWQSRAASALGDTAAATESLTLLTREFPCGFYALLLKGTGDTVCQAPLLKEIPVEALPLPDGYERVKGLISLGLTDDASLELSAGKKKLSKGKGDAAIARLYLELGNYNGAMALYNGTMLKRTENSMAWAFLYPKAFGDLVVRYSEAAGIDPSLSFAIMRAESAFTPVATSPVGARGLMQLMPQTAAMVLHEKKIDPERLYDPELNIRLGTKHLRELIDKFGGNQTAVIASYNAGAHNVNRWLKTYANLKGEEFIESIPFSETRDYVKKVLAVQAIYRRLYGMK